MIEVMGTFVQKLSNRVPATVLNTKQGLNYVGRLFYTYRFNFKYSLHVLYLEENQ